MKNAIFLMMAIVVTIFISGCMKDLGTDVVPEKNGPELKTSGQMSAAGDTAFAQPNKVLKFWLENINPTNYNFSWNLGNGDQSNAESPEKKYSLGVYDISVIITPLSGGDPITREIVLVIENINGDESIILYSATYLNGNYDYGLAFSTEAIYNYGNLTGNPWSTADWTDWEKRFLTESVLINGTLYLIDHVTLPANNIVISRFTYGRGVTYAYNPESLYWQSDGVFGVYLTDGQISPDPIDPSPLPGNAGDDFFGTVQPTVRNEIKYSSGGYDSLRIFINYSQYANGSFPFIAIFDGTWKNELLVKMTGQYEGWGFRTIEIQEIGPEGFNFKFGENINLPNNYGDMHNSMYYLPPPDDICTIQIYGIEQTKNYERYKTSATSAK